MLSREALEAMLAEGCSLEEIGRRVDRHPSTVSYWLKKHGLEPIHHDRHASRGGLTREQLEPLRERGLSIREIAAELDRGTATVRYWLRKLDLQTPPRVARPAALDTVCPVHGPTPHATRSDGYARCIKCRSMAVSERRRTLKKILVEEAGGCCARCGYDRCIRALAFHHEDPETKRFSLANNGITRSLTALREEAAKCILLCANCHAEEEARLATLP